jgi:hypothetical protein
MMLGIATVLSNVYVVSISMFFDADSLVRVAVRILLIQQYESGLLRMHVAARLYPGTC